MFLIMPIKNINSVDNTKEDKVTTLYSVIKILISYKFVYKK